MTCVPPQIYVWSAGLASCAYWTGISVVPEDWLSSAGTGVRPTDSEQRHSSPHCSHLTAADWSFFFLLWKINLEAFCYFMLNKIITNHSGFKSFRAAMLISSRIILKSHTFPLAKENTDYPTLLYENCTKFSSFEKYEKGKFQTHKNNFRSHFLALIVVLFLNII